MRWTDFKYHKQFWHCVSWFLSGTRCIFSLLGWCLEVEVVKFSVKNLKGQLLQASIGSLIYIYICERILKYECVNVFLWECVCMCLSVCMLARAHVRVRECACKRLCFIVCQLQGMVTLLFNFFLFRNEANELVLFPGHQWQRVRSRGIYSINGDLKNLTIVSLIVRFVNMHLLVNMGVILYF